MSSLLACAGSGVEIAKNVVLAGVKSVTIFDHLPVALTDLSSQFFLTEADIGKPRDQVTRSKLAELNPYVPISVLDVKTGLSESALSQFQIMVLTDVPLADQIRINDFCHSRNIAFISTDAYGLCGYAFCDAV